MDERMQEVPCNLMIQNRNFAGFGFSRQGTSHMKSGKPCQDYCEMRYLERQQTLIAVIADGLGSCSLSHIGAACAVNTALESLSNALSRLPVTPDGHVSFDYQTLLDQAFTAARQQVEQLASEQHRPVPVYQSTLTAAIYNGGQLYCCHVGDDGIVAQFTDGTVGMVTRRMKGEEANSVYPLQTGRWEISVSPKQVAGFLMSTDGVLDAFVKDSRHIPYFEGIYYPFMSSAMERLQDEGASKTGSFFNEYVNKPAYRQRVQDDLTVLSVIDLRLMKGSKKPQFDEKCWKKSVEAWKAKVDRELNESNLGTRGSRTNPFPQPPDRVISGGGGGHIQRGGDKRISYMLVALGLVVVLLLALLIWNPDHVLNPIIKDDPPTSTVTTSVETTPFILKPSPRVGPFTPKYRKPIEPKLDIPLYPERILPSQPKKTGTSLPFYNGDASEKAKTFFPKY